MIVSTSFGQNISKTEIIRKQILQHLEAKKNTYNRQISDYNATTQIYNDSIEDINKLYLDSLDKQMMKVNRVLVNQDSLLLLTNEQERQIVKTLKKCHDDQQILNIQETNNKLLISQVENAKVLISDLKTQVDVNKHISQDLKTESTLKDNEIKQLKIKIRKIRIKNTIIIVGVVIITIIVL